MRNRFFGVLAGWTLTFWGAGFSASGLAWGAASGAPLAAQPQPGLSANGEGAPIVTPDTAPPPAARAAPTGAVAVSVEAPAALGYVLPIAGAPLAPERPPKGALAGARAVRTAPAPVTAPSKRPPQSKPVEVASLTRAAPVEEPSRRLDAPAMTRAKLCISDHAAKVARVDTSVVDAVELLIRDVCAESVGAAAREGRPREEPEALTEPDAFRDRPDLSPDPANPEDERPPAAQTFRPSHDDAPMGAPRPALAEAILRSYAADRVLAEKARFAHSPRRTH